MDFSSLGNLPPILLQILMRFSTNPHPPTHHPSVALRLVGGVRLTVGDGRALGQKKKETSLKGVFLFTSECRVNGSCNGGGIPARTLLSLGRENLKSAIPRTSLSYFFPSSLTPSCYLTSLLLLFHLALCLFWCLGFSHLGVAQLSGSSRSGRDGGLHR